MASARLTALRDQFDQVRSGIDTIERTAEQRGDDLTDDEQSQVDTLYARAEQLRGELEPLAARERSLQATGDVLRSLGLAQEGVRRDHGVHAAGGDPQPDPSLERAFDAYLRTGVPNQDLTRAQGVGDPTAGGFLVTPGFRQKLVEAQKAFGGFAAEADSFTTNTGGPLEYPTIDDTANSGEIVAESAAASGGADLVFGTVNLGAYKYTSTGAGGVPLRLSVELVQDSEFDVQSLASRVLGTRIARAQAAHWVTGTGVGQPKGIVAPSLTANETSDAAGVFDYDDMLDTEGQLDPAYEQNAKWLMNKATWSQIRGLLDSSGRPIIQPLLDGITGRPIKSLIGYPVVIDQAMPNLATSGAFFAVLGDFREAYVIRRVSNLAVLVDPYSRAANGEIQITAWERADGNIQNRLAYVICKNV